VTTTTYLNRAQRDSYQAKGHLVIAGIVPETFLDGMRRLLEALVEQRISQWWRAGLLHVPIASLGLRHALPPGLARRRPPAG
jgi:hypothetical protein